MATIEQRQRIRDIFKAKGGQLTTRDLVLAVQHEGVYTVDDLARITFRAIQSDCRRALAEEDTAGLPFAQPVGVETPDDDDEAAAPLWQQLNLFTYEQACALLARRGDELRADHQKLLTLRAWVRERFGKAPKIPSLG